MERAAVARFFSDRPEARRLFRAVLAAAPPCTLRVTRSQIVLQAERAFAWVWCPDRWLKGPVAPLVLTLALPRRVASPRWKEVSHPARARWMHHLELYSVDDVDAFVRARLRDAAKLAAPAARRGRSR